MMLFIAKAHIFSWAPSFIMATLAYIKYEDNSDFVKLGYTTPF